MSEVNTRLMELVRNEQQHQQHQQQRGELMTLWCRRTLIVQTQFLLKLRNQELCVDVSGLPVCLRSIHHLLVS